MLVQRTLPTRTSIHSAFGRGVMPGVVDWANSEDVANSGCLHGAHRRLSSRS